MSVNENHISMYSNAFKIIKDIKFKLLSTYCWFNLYYHNWYKLYESIEDDN